MTQAQKYFRKQLLAKIHMHYKFKEIKANGAWEDWLEYRFGVSSCKNLSINELNLVLGILSGAKQDGLNFEPDLSGRNLIDENKITPKQITQIVALKEALGWSDTALLRFMLRQIKFSYLNINGLVNLNKKQATAIITGLEKIAVGYIKKENKK